MMRSFSWKGVIYEADPEAVDRNIAPEHLQHNVDISNGRDHIRRLVEMIKKTAE